MKGAICDSLGTCTRPRPEQKISGAEARRPFVKPKLLAMRHFQVTAFWGPRVELWTSRDAKLHFVRTAWRHRPGSKTVADAATTMSGAGRHDET